MKKGMVFLSVRLITLVIILSLFVVAFIFYQNMRYKTIEDRNEINKYIDVLDSRNLFFKSRKCMDMNHIDDYNALSGLALLERTKLDYFNITYRNKQLPCFVNSKNNYEIEIETMPVSYRMIPNIINLGTYILVLDYSSSLKYPVSDDTSLLKKDLLKEAAISLVERINETVERIRNDASYGFPDVTLKFEVVFFNTYYNNIVVVYGLDDFNADEIIKDISDFVDNNEPRGGTPLYDVLYDISQSHKDSTFIVVSDFCSQGDTHTINDVRHSLRSNDNVVYAVGTGSNLMQSFRSVADVPGRNKKCEYVFYPDRGIVNIVYKSVKKYSGGRWVEDSFECPPDKSYEEIKGVVYECGSFGGVFDIKNGGDYVSKYCRIDSGSRTSVFYVDTNMSYDINSICSSEGVSLSEVNEGFYVEGNNEAAISSSFNSISDKIRDNVYGVLEDEIKVVEVKYDSLKWHFGVFNNTPEYIGGKKVIMSMPVVIIDKERGNVFGFMKFMSHEGVFEEIYSTVYKLCRSDKDVEFNRDYTIPDNVISISNSICMGNMCKELDCRYSLRVDINKGRNVVRFKKDGTQLEVKSI